MKIAFLCEGFSERDSMVPLLTVFGAYNYEFLKKPSDVPSIGKIGIYRHNYKNVGLIRKEYLEFSKFLIDAHNFIKVFVWFDNERIMPVCEYARVQYQTINTTHQNKIELLICVEKLENWFLSNNQILNQLLEQTVDNSYISSRGGSDFLSTTNVDTLSASSILDSLKKGTRVCNFSKQKLATRFFSLINKDLQYKSDSLTRFISKIDQEFSRLNRE